MIDYFAKVLRAAWNTCKGLGLTLKYLFKPAITVHYPDEKLVPYERFRGALLFDAVTCISCNLCVKACPSTCIDLENATIPDPKNPQARKKVARVEWYSIDFGKCNFCRLCEESCPTKPKSVWHSLDYELVFFSRDEMVRCWKAGMSWVGQYWDRRAKQFKDPPGQVRIMEVDARR
ncbi:MAG: NADH-quinone oxidoreductase subunit I [Elusimicrobia bacterium]|nr:NADH-quinone oxidoreductase subunit I [Elusimicrobiota bacterium]MDE2237310.1 NADH-quinone oxidoreductase subunit I [Elusimicrobiota bacterium]MDE2425447.1 NADH-quinone oxidoreductase subunit I [Elusimicrobiota bacterium]